LYDTVERFLEYLLASRLGRCQPFLLSFQVALCCDNARIYLGDPALLVNEFLEPLPAFGRSFFHRALLVWKKETPAGP